jgi:hypothetical protein
MAVEICPIRPINLGGQLEHLEGNIISRRRNIVEYGRKQSFPISGIDSGAVGNAGHVSFPPSKSAAARFRGRSITLQRTARASSAIAAPAAPPREAKSGTGVLRRGGVIANNPRLIGLKKIQNRPALGALSLADAVKLSLSLPLSQS